MTSGSIATFQNAAARLIKKCEPWLFAVATAASPWPLYKNPHILSLDGAAHSYNALIIKEMIFNNLSAFLELYQFNDFFIPNWTGHVVMVMIHLLGSPQHTELIFLGVLIIGTAYSFRYLVTSVDRMATHASYLIFLTFYNHFYILGFYNFLFSFIPAFFFLGYLIRHQGQLNAGHALVLCLLLCTVYYSHGFVFLLCLSLGIGLWCIDHVQKLKERKTLVDGMYFGLALMPSLVILSWFLTTVPELEPLYLEFDKVLELFWENASLILFSGEERKYTQPVFIGLLLLTVLAFYLRIRELYRSPQLRGPDIFGLASLSLLVLVFVTPDSDRWNGYYVVRTILLFNITMIIWLAVSKIPRYVMIVAIAGMGVFHEQRVDHYIRVVKQQQSNLASIVKAGDQIPSEAKVMVYDATGHWLFGHMTARAATVNGAIQLTNYEASLGYFPLRWRSDVNWKPELDGDEADGSFFGWQPMEGSILEKPQFVFVLGRLKTGHSDRLDRLKKAIESDYDEVFREEISHLYKLKH